MQAVVVPPVKPEAQPQPPPPPVPEEPEDSDDAVSSGSSSDTDSDDSDVLSAYGDPPQAASVALPACLNEMLTDHELRAVKDALAARAAKVKEAAEVRVERVRKWEKNRLDIEAIEIALRQPCCTKNCQEGYTVTKCLALRQYYSELASGDQGQWLLDAIWEWRGNPTSWISHVDPQTDRVRLTPDPAVVPAQVYFKLLGKSVCK